MSVVDSSARSSAANDALVVAEIPCCRCGYLLKGLHETGHCPECGEQVSQSTRDRPPVVVPRAKREWSILVLAGLLLLLWVVPGQIETVLSMHFSYGVGGTAPRLNIPAPKIWAVPTVQRSIGYRPEYLGVGGTLSSMIAVASVFLLTSRQSKFDWNESTLSLRRITRVGIAMLAGGWLGFVMCMEGLDGSDVAIGKYVNVAIGAVELPCTVLLYLWLARVARLLDDSPLERTFKRCALAAGTLMAIATGLIIASQVFELDRRELGWQIVSSLFMAGCLTCGLVVVSAILRLGIDLFRVAIPSVPGRRNS